MPRATQQNCSLDNHELTRTRLIMAIVHSLAAICVSSCGLMPGSRSMETVVYPAGIRETRQQITGKTELRISGESVRVSIQGLGTGDFKGIYWPKSAPNPTTLDSSVPWRFELLEQSGGIRERLQWSEYPEILRVTIQGKTVFDASVCEVHQLPMVRVIETADEFAGRRMPQSFQQARTQFPHSGTDFPVCTFLANSTLTWRCTECAASVRMWCHKHALNAPLL